MENRRVPDYTRKAIEKYKSTKYIVNAALPLEYKELIKQAGFSGNGFINMAVRNELARMGLLPDRFQEETKPE